MSHLRCTSGLFLLSMLVPVALARGDTPRFIRGDVNATGGLDITDGVVIFNHLFFSSPSRLLCDDAADVDDMGDILLTDGVFLLNYLFLGGPRPPEPAPPNCGVDLTDDRFGCERFDPCFDIGPRKCGGIVGQGCLPGEFCEFPPGTCDVADNQGECVVIPEGCPDVFDPVCGCDGRTYGNDCDRRAAGVSKAHDGECGGTRTCDGIAGLPCAADEFCEHPPGTCDVVDGAGVCVKRPEACLQIFDPVCGCDGRTYSNDCTRQAAGVSKAHDGPCDQTQVCGGIQGIPCDEGEFCELPPGTCQGADFQGECVPIPTACPDVFDPVCGCDGRTYGNDCERRIAGVQKDHDGECGMSRACDGIGGIPCAEDEFCEHPPGTCNVADVQGTCVKRPGPCPEFFDPVCGCDGVTYSNDCFRQAAGVSKDRDGRCEDPPPRVCDGFAGIPCEAGEFCEHPAGECQVADGQGVCVPIPAACPPVFEPVCGCDGRTYGNDCERQAAGVSKDHDGPCVK